MKDLARVKWFLNAQNQKLIQVHIPNESDVFLMHMLHRVNSLQPCFRTHNIHTLFLTCYHTMQHK